MTHFLAVRDVRRARAFYADVLGRRVVMKENPCMWLVRGAHPLTAPLDRGAEIRCSTRDPDGYLIEVGQATGLVEGRLVELAPAGREVGRADGR
jgi:hypothetical protein